MYVDTYIPNHVNLDNHPTLDYLQEGSHKEQQGNFSRYMEMDNKQKQVC